ncbi:mitochondrial inner membrane protease subunit 2 isoform X2 [Vanacampus margaritifer]
MQDCAWPDCDVISCAASRLPPVPVRMAQGARWGRRYLRAFVSGFFVAVPVTVTVLDRLAYVARVEGASMQPFLNPDGASECDVVLLNRWNVRNYHVQRGDIVSIMSPKNPEQKIIKRVIGLEGDFIRSLANKRGLMSHVARLYPF